MVDRKSRYLIGRILENLKTSSTSKSLSDAIARIGKQFGKVKSITSDNGSEFWGHQELRFDAIITVIRMLLGRGVPMRIANPQKIFP